MAINRCVCRAAVINGLLALGLVAGVSSSSLADKVISREKARKSEREAATLWYDLRLVGVEGQVWDDVESPYDRLPARAKDKVRDEVWKLSRNSAGLCARFVTDAPKIEVAWDLTSPSLAMVHMPATGVSGIDLYVKDEADTWRWLAIARPTAKSNKYSLVSDLERKPREYLLYLPLYNGVTSVELGLPSDATLSRAASYPAGHEKPIVFYGTSITQGGCASRPGNIHTAILGRRLNFPVINLGFSGNGKMEPEITDLLTEIDAAVFVIDCVPNMTVEEVRDRSEPLVKTLREKHPQTPILLVEDRTFSNAFLNAQIRQKSADSRAELKAAFERLKSAGVANLYYLEGDKLLGDALDNEGTVDGSHPNDLGFFRQANAFEEALRPLVGTSSGS